MAIFQISEYPCIGNTDLDTRRFFGSRIHPCLAEITLVHFLGFGVQVTCSIRTGRDTLTAADAEVTFDQHPPVDILVGRPSRAGGNTTWLITVVTKTFIKK